MGDEKEQEEIFFFLFFFLEEGEEGARTFLFWRFILVEMVGERGSREGVAGSGE